MITTHDDQLQIVLKMEEQIEGLILEHDQHTHTWHWHYDNINSHALYGCSDGFPDTFVALMHFTAFICEELKAK